MDTPVSATNWTEQPGEFLLIVAGRTHHAPYLSHWHDFKDHIRKVVKEQPGWVDVYASRTQCLEEKQGWCRLRLIEDAKVAYRSCISEGTQVHLWQTCRSSDSSRLMDCTCTLPFRLSQEVHRGIDVREAHRLGGELRPVPRPQYDRLQATCAHLSHPLITYTAQSAQTKHTLQTLPTKIMPQMHAAGSKSMPVVPRDGAIPTGSCGILISNLCHTVNTYDLHDLISSMGRYLECKVLQTRFGKSSGLAKARFASTQEARAMIDYLHGRNYKGSVLEVYLDEGTTPAGKVGPPLIVNGSAVNHTTAQNTT